ncbi:DUF5672 family protein [Pedobacter sp. BMA]|uniref:DUF5672 family protein n=1 Tax=Pedobacter sp. BMA TaxID=1663685 RepID=UPI00064B330C|nr:DUF5672 family protein [Pedobacter sp. BMA]KLT66629.1 hypothetical protein AB669_05505 [Pedobacter sp. BMA]
MKNLVAVTIPIYKIQIDPIEQISLSQVIKKLGNYPIIFFAPNSLDTKNYEKFCEEKIPFVTERFNDEYFADIAGYNKLMLSKSFYKRFIDFKYILTYQLDAFVFKDELTYWCNKGYDYIGAPYLYVDLNTYPIKVLTKYRRLLDYLHSWNIPFYRYRHLGNGGLSLRNINSTLRLLTICNRSARSWTTLMEDNFFQYWGNVLFPIFKLPPEIEAARFSIELDPEKTFMAIGEELPFGCHAFMRYSPEFWKTHIEAEGYSIE